VLAIRLPEEMETRLACLARDTGRTKTFYAREAIMRHIEDLEDLYIAEARLVEYRAGRSQSHSLEEVERRLGLAD
jgi:RHH-type transcriptional regulator, rel operon repressor / antitoxin RelB